MEVDLLGAINRARSYGNLSACVAGGVHGAFARVAARDVAGLACERSAGANGADDRRDRSAADSREFLSSRSATCVAPWVVWWTLFVERVASLLCAAGQPDCWPRSAVRTKSGFPPDS